MVFVDDGLARGAAVMARCMNSMGTPKNPLGGLRGGKCILKERIDYELSKGATTMPQQARPDRDTQAYFVGGHREHKDAKEKQPSASRRKGDNYICSGH